MAGQLNRREFLSGAAGGVGLVAAGAVLAACGGSSHKTAKSGALHTFAYVAPTTLAINFVTELLAAGGDAALQLDWGSEILDL